MDINKLFIKVIIFISVTLSLSCQLPHPTPPVIVKELPNRVGYVNDFASILKEDTRKGLEIKLKEFDKKYNVEFVIVTVNSNGNRTPLEYSEFIKEKWGINPKSSNDKKFLINFSKVPQNFQESVTNELLSTFTPKKSEELEKLLTEETKNQSLDESLTKYIDAVISTIADSSNKENNNS